MRETVFTYAAPALKFGIGASAEVGHDLAGYGARRVLLVTDPGVMATGHPTRIAEQVWQHGIETVVFDRARVEPTDESLGEAIAFALDAESTGRGVLVVMNEQILTASEAQKIHTESAGSFASPEFGPVGVLDAGMVSYVMVSGRSEIPGRASAHCSALGKVLLSGLSVEDLDRFLEEDELVALTPHTIVDKDLLRARIEQIRVQGHGTYDRELDLHMRCVTVPIRDRRNRIIAAISGSARPAALDSTRQVELRLALDDAAEGIAAQLYPTAANTIPT
jgi:hypothetical protein